jgi:histidyl-tRNA synthetase
VAAARARLLAVATATFDAFGYEPITTPALEHEDILRGKGSVEHDRQMFTFEDQGGRPVGMRFDLTVPLARFYSQHRHLLASPARLYQAGPVWRGERPQRGRFREFWQCDADIIGSESPAADAEIVAMFAAVLDTVRPGGYVVHVSHRKLAEELTRAVLGEQAPVGAVLGAVDKLAKIGEEAVVALIAEAGVPGERAAALLSLLGAVRAEDDPERGLTLLADAAPALPQDTLDGLRAVLDHISHLGTPISMVRFDPAIVRGLDYYTGVVFESFSVAEPELGSVASGGRYDGLVERFLNERSPGVGGSLGIDRLLEVESESPALRRSPLVFVAAAAGDAPEKAAVARLLREHGFRVAVAEVAVAPKKVRAAAKRAAASVIVEATPDDYRVAEPVDGPFEPHGTAEQVLSRLARLLDRGRG